MNHDRYDDHWVRGWLRDVKSIAIIGASANEIRPSFFVARYMAAKRFDLFPINPGHAGKPIAGAMTHASLSDLPGPVDMVDVFRKPEALPGIVDDILAQNWRPKLVWLQLGIRDDAIAARLEAEGIAVIQDRCPKIEYARLCGEIAWMGFNRRTISSKKPLLAKGFQHFGLGE